MLTILTFLLDHATSIGTLIASGGALFASIRNGQKIQRIHVEINSRLTELLASKSETSRLAGKEEGRDTEMLRAAEAIKTASGPKL